MKDKELGDNNIRHLTSSVKGQSNQAIIQQRKLFSKCDTIMNVGLREGMQK